MQNSPKRPRALRPNRLFFERDQLRKDVATLESANESKVQADISDPLKFLEICHLKPYNYVLDLIKLYLEYQFVAARMSRQVGKSTTFRFLFLWDAWNHPNTNTAFLGPTWRQTKLNIRGVSSLCRFLPQQGLHCQKTRITLPNGSIIEAFPNNPDAVRGFTFDRAWLDETNFIPNAEDLYDAVLFAMGTKKDAKLVATSTPFNSDSLFGKMCFSDEFADFGRYHLSFEQALEPDGPLSPSMVEKIKRQYGNDPSRWRREMLAEYSEDEDVWLSQSLIVSCIESALEPYPFDSLPSPSEFYMGVDLGQKQDASVVVVIEKQGQTLRVVHVHRFLLNTQYASVIGYAKSLQDRWREIRSVYVDYTGVGIGIVEEMVQGGIKGVEGVTFTVNSKEDMANILRERMRQGELKIPYVPVRKSGDIDLTAELNVERYELAKTGHVGFSHPQGTHDDVFWAMALSCFSAVQSPLAGKGAVMMPPEEHTRRW